MEMILCRLQSIVQTIDQIPLSSELVQCIKSKVAYIYERLSERSINKTTSPTFYDAILQTISEIEDLLFLPAVNHLLLRSKGNDGENSNTSPKAKNIGIMLEKRQELCPLQCARTSQEKQMEKTSVSPVSEDEQLLCGIADDEYWERRTKRMNEILGDTSIRLCKTLKPPVRRDTQLKSSSMESNLDKEIKNLAKISKRSKRKISFKLPEKDREQKYDQNGIDKFWGISEDISEYEKERKSGDTICVINCKSELKKLTDFLKTKGLRSFYIKQKPKGLAGNKGTWITPPYVPPIEVKYGWPK